MVNGTLNDSKARLGRIGQSGPIFYHQRTPIKHPEITQRAPRKHSPHLGSVPLSAGCHFSFINIFNHESPGVCFPKEEKENHDSKFFSDLCHI